MLNLNKNRKNLWRAVAIIGTQRKMAKMFGISAEAVANWLKRSKHGIPSGMAYMEAIEKATNGLVTRHDLRSDIYGTKPPK